jgi:hypothetical protein
MTYEDAQKEALKVKWKATPCLQGEECWCRIIEPVEPILYDGDEEYYIAGSGSIPKLEAEYLVELHNRKL